jgi:hypothetical protein
MYRTSVFHGGSRKTFWDYCQLDDLCPFYDERLYYFIARGLIPTECEDCVGIFVPDDRSTDRKAVAKSVFEHTKHDTAFVHKT